jgi:hypothetical protein
VLHVSPKTGGGHESGGVVRLPTCTRVTR